MNESNPSHAYFFMDAHLDLSMNALEWNRDLRWSVEEIRAAEKGMTDKPDRGKGTVSFPSLREGNVGLVVGVLRRALLQSSSSSSSSLT